MATTTKVKVARAALIERLTAAQQVQWTAYQNKRDVYQDEFEEFCIQIATKARTFSTLVNTPSAQDARELLEAHGASNEWRHQGVSITFAGVTMPTEPTPPSDDIAKLIRTLELSTEDTIVVSASDSYYRYI